MDRRYRILIGATILTALLAAPWSGFAADVMFQNVPAKVYFSPGSKQVRAVVKEIDNATMEVVVQSYSLDSLQIVRALQSASKRAVNVEVMVDRSCTSRKSPLLRSLTDSGIPVYVYGSHDISRNEIVIIDKATLITGSLGLSAGGGEKNGESALIIRSKELAGLYLDNWLSHKERSRAYRYQAKPAGKRMVRKKPR